jgi:hypothetical protein
VNVKLRDLFMAIPQAEFYPIAADSSRPDTISTVPHVAFEVNDLETAITGQPLLIAPNSPSNSLILAMIEVNGAPVELMQFDHMARPDL